MEVSEGPGIVVGRVEASSARTVAGREGRLDAVWAPEAEKEGSGETGGGPGAPGEAGGRVEAPAGAQGPAEGQGDWETPGSPRTTPRSPKVGEGEAWVPEGIGDEVRTPDGFACKRSWRRRRAGL